MASPAVANSPPRTVEGHVYFLQHDEKFKVEKPYTFKYAGLCRSGPNTNAQFEHRVIALTDMRGNEESFSIEVNGFSILKIENDLTYEDYHDAAGQAQYFRQLEDLIKDRLHARRVKVFRHGLRKRDPLFPVKKGEPYENDQPTTLAHIDATLEEACREVEIQEGEKAADVLKNRFQWINIWKPLKGPMNDWPLAVCDASSVNSVRDVMASDLVYPDHVAENVLLCHSPEQKWFYLSNHLPSEAIIFKQTDSSSSACRGVPHCSFANPQAPIDEDPRESIEARLLVFYDE